MRYHSYNPDLAKIIGTPWDRTEAIDLTGVRKKVGEDLVEWPGLPDRIFTEAECKAAGMRAVLMDIKKSDIVVMLIVKTVYKGDGFDHNGSLWIEPVLYSQMESRIDEMRRSVINGTMKVILAYSENGQMFYWNDLRTVETARLPDYGKKMKRGSNQVPRRELKEMAAGAPL